MPQIQDLLEDEMPREKLINLGPLHLSDAELLAIILRVGIKGKSVLDLSREILREFSTNLVSRKTYHELLEFRGISKAKACQIVALFEISRRFSQKGFDKNMKLNSSNDVFEYVKADFSNLPEEKVMCVFVDSKNQVIKKEFVGEGSINYTIIEPRKIIRKCLIYSASGFFLIHNHPSQDITPSQEDKNITKKIHNIAKSLNLRFLDHLIVSNLRHYSMFDEDIL
ncbi:MAG: DNA repair protein RadC [Candidatus Woesearchaeota archaeon]|jgi:DNA repair protein RadC|nr:DNA repair protein RadC [Candidatus Woesearchaeota archaeon]